VDATTGRLVDYALQARYEDLPASVVEATKLRLIDTLACVAGAYSQPLSVAARDLAARYTMNPGATVLGGTRGVAPEMAAFANGVMLRVLDLSDMYRVKSGGHPSDVIAALLAAAEMGARDGRSFIAAIAVAYEIYCSCCDAIDLNSAGWDQPVYGIVAATAAAGRLMGLDRERLGHAIALAIVPNMALYQTRHGELSSWKGCAGANASRNALFAVSLARSGFTGPEAPIEGKHGLWDIAGRFDWPLEPGRPPNRIERTHIKCFPVCYHGQSAVWAALALRQRVRIEDVESIEVRTHRTAFNLMASSPSRWAPATHETADHSLPYVVARALLDGRITEASFAESRLRDPRMAALMARTKVMEDPDLTAHFPESSPCRVLIRMTSGAEVSDEVRYPKGHESRPMSASEVHEKFRQLFDGYGERRQADNVLAAAGNLERLEDIGELFAQFRRDDTNKPRR